MAENKHNPTTSKSPVMTMNFNSFGGGAGPNAPVCMNMEPYPSVDAAPADPKTVAIIKQNRSGAAGELTAIAQYIFQNNRTDEENFANGILQIALVEMMHLDMLGDAIQALGGKPTFDDGKYYWQAGAVNYADKLPGMLRANIEDEQTAIKNYEQSVADTPNEQVKALFRRIITDEQLHIVYFTDLLAKVAP